MSEFDRQGYLKDLLEFARQRVRFSSNGSSPGEPPASIQDVAARLATAFLQPFDHLIEDEHQGVGAQSVLQIRLAVEILRGYLASLSVDSAQADQRYRQAAYQTLLRNIGTSYEEIRILRAAGEDEIEQARQSLAERLGIDRVDRLDDLYLPLDGITEAKLEGLFGLLPITRDPFDGGQPRPALLKWRMDRLRMLWKAASALPSARGPVALIDPDLIGEQMIVDPEKLDGTTFIDSDVIDPDARQAPLALWHARTEEIGGMVADVQTTIQAAIKTQPTLLAAYDQVLDAVVGNVDLETALKSRTESAPDPHGDGNQPLESLDLSALRRLARLRKLAASGTLTDPEWADATGILVQFKKRQRFAAWQAEEQEKGLFLSPDFFVLPDTPIHQPLPPWRATRQARLDWTDALRARVKQTRTTIQALQAAIDATARAVLIELRDGLIAALAVHADLPDETLLADQLTRRLLVDFKNRDGRETTRLEQVIDAVQGLFFALRMGRSIDADLPDDNPARDWSLKTDDDFTEADFDQAWHWMGSYATRRAVEFVKDYPENYLLPSLRDRGEAKQPANEPAFWLLIRALRARPRLTPGQARQLANEGIGDPAPDSPDAGYLRRLREQVSLPPRLRGSFEITEQLSTADVQARKDLVKGLFGDQDITRNYTTDEGNVIKIRDPHLAPSWLREIFYFVPMAIALQLQRSGEYLAALDWYQTVYAYQLPLGERKIYHGLELEGVFSDRPRVTPGIWLRDELNPHYFARERKDAYSRFTMMSIVQCLLDFADAEFTLATGESLPRARTLYLTAVDLLARPEMPAANPVIDALRLHAGLNLDKLRGGRNVAGIERPPEPEPAETAPTDGFSDLPVIGSGGQLVVRRAVSLQPTPYRYAVLVERAKQLVDLARQMEAAYLSTLEKRDAEAYNLLRARQDLELSQATVQLQSLRVGEADLGVTLAGLQQDRAEIQRDIYQTWIDAGLNQWEQSMIDGYQDAAEARTLAAFFNTSLQFIQIAASAAGGGPFGVPTAAPLAAAAAVAQAGSLAATSNAISAETRAEVASVHAGYERRKQEWQLQQHLAEQDVDITGQRINLAVKQKDIAAQEYQIAGTRSEHARAAVDFLSHKFTNAELYEWMSGILARVYSYFLQQATAMAQMAQNQLAFERQEPPPTFIQADYWQVPTEAGAAGAADGATSDRRGLTGSARLLEDIYRLDQYAFETNKRKLQLSQTFSLARLAPFEFQRFRETGVLSFATPLELFDRGFPGHYLRLIKRVRTSVVALIPPTRGIRATLTASGVSRVITGKDVFQTTVVRRSPELVAFTSPMNATGLFELAPAGEMLLPFESMGVDTLWELRMPKAANPFDFRAIADVLLTIEYTAFDSFDYRRQVIERLDRRAGAERSFSFRHEFADAWYDLHNPEQVAEQQRMVVRFETRRGDFPPNLDDLKIEQLLLYFARAGGAPSEIPVTHLHFTPRGGEEVPGGSATTIDGVISTRRANGASWIPLTGTVPVGEWELALPDTSEVRALFKGEAVEDVLFVIAYAGETPAWPT